jgi:hypothetical protein
MKRELVMAEKTLLVEPSTLDLYEQNRLNHEETVRKFLNFLKHNQSESVQQPLEIPQHP